MRFKSCFIVLSVFALTTMVSANQLQIPVYSTTTPKILIGNVTFKDTDYGLLITPNLKGIAPGMKGFHIHQTNDCNNHGMDAGGHFDPDKTNSHQGPYGEGHLGDLPTLYVNAKKNAVQPILAPRITTADLAGHALMIHENGDNYSNTPPLGGGGARIACGVFAKKAIKTP